MLLPFLSFIDLYYLIPCVIAQIVTSTAELVIPIKIPTKEAKAEMKANPVIAEIKISKSSILFNTLQIFYFFLLSNSF